MRKLIAPLLAAALIAGGHAAPAAAQSRNDQANARKEMQAGQALPSREIERRIVPQRTVQGEDYLGFEYDAMASAYRLKFIRGTQVTWVDVDARTGRVLRVSK
jgi:hypothetical protein